MPRHPTNLELTGRPAFVRELREWALGSSYLGDDTRFHLVLDRDDDRTLFVSFQDATRWVWHVLHQLPEAVAGRSEALFILGFNPSAAGHYQATDLLPLLHWHQCLAPVSLVDCPGIREWTPARTEANMQDAKHEFIVLLEELDTLLMPRLLFWRALRERAAEL